MNLPKPQFTARLNAQFGIFRKIVLLSILLTVLPLMVIGFYTFQTVNLARNEISSQATVALNRKTIDALEMQAFHIASAVRTFLEQVENDLLLLRDIPATSGQYAAFAHHKRAEVWGNYAEAHRQELPLYKELSFVDAAGNERVKVRDGQALPEEQLRNVRAPENTTYRVETYFERTRTLPPGGIYAARLTGFYISKPEHLQGYANPENASRNTSIYYDGVIRFATPVYRNGSFQGIVTLGLDQRHLMSFTQHVLPLSKEEVSFPVYNSGNYAFMFDDEGWIITHPKLWDIRGVDARGRWVTAYNEHTPPETVQAGFIPFNLDSSAFIHENYPIVSREVRSKRGGTVTTKNVGGITKIMSYAPIEYDRGEYARHGIFGGITVGAEIVGFHSPARFVENQIDATLTSYRSRLWWILLVAILVSTLTSTMLSHGFAKPIIRITRGANEIAMGSLDKRIDIQREDEIGTLADSFNHMADQLEKSRARLLATISELQQSKQETETYAAELEYQITILKSIQRISNILGTTFNMKTVIGLILEDCVNSIGFDRAILYLIDERQKYLECSETCGFTPENEIAAQRSRFNLERFDCIETRVVKEGRIIFVEDFNRYSEATDLDRKIRQLTRNRSFVYVPLKVKEKIIGILGADKVRSDKAITKTDINSLQILANQASRVIENTRLYQEVINQRNFVEDIISNMQNGVITIDHHGRITSINQAASQILSRPETMPASGDPAGLSEEALALIDDVKTALFSEGAYSNYNMKLEQGEGLKYLNIKASLIQKNGLAHDGIIIIEDFTEKKQLDDQIQQLERLASLGRFGASIAHEIRNPLTGVSLFLDNLHDRTAAQPEVAQLVEKALSEIERLERLTHEILIYTHPAAGEQRQVNLNEIAANVLSFVEPQCRQQGIDINSRLAEELPPSLVNPDRMRQALLNLCLNAIQAMPEGGVLTLSTRHINRAPTVVQSSISGNIRGWVKIQVQDNGPGISPQERKKIFEPFYSKKKRGSGLGLATTHSIVSAHNGAIKVGGKVGSGAVFTIYLPLFADP